ncbi:MAG: hypothetical protein LBB53_02385 [Prevotellaceae bacterium]|jgi:hypothetical protein|nr:hypothetical protein [Prevotellaceae bacterium]
MSNRKANILLIAGTVIILIATAAVILYQEWFKSQFPLKYNDNKPLIIKPFQKKFNKYLLNNYTENWDNSNQLKFIAVNGILDKNTIYGIYKYYYRDFENDPVFSTIVDKTPETFELSYEGYKKIMKTNV